MQRFLAPLRETYIDGLSANVIHCKHFDFESISFHVVSDMHEPSVQFQETN